MQIFLISKTTVVTVMRKKNLRGQGEETLTGNRLKRELDLIWVIQDLCYMWSKK